MNFAIVVEKTTLATCIMESAEKHQLELTRGVMVEIMKDTNGHSTIKVHDYYQKHFAYEHNLYFCKSSALFPVAVEIWPFLIAISDPLERTFLARDLDHVHFVLSLEVDDFVTVNGKLFDVSPMNQSLMFLPEREPKNKTLDYECVVKYIGPVDEVGPGYIFGLELLVIYENWTKPNQIPWKSILHLLVNFKLYLAPMVESSSKAFLNILFFLNCIDWMLIIILAWPSQHSHSTFFFSSQNYDKGISPQAPDISHFGQNYVDTPDPNSIFLLPANFIRKQNSKTLRRAKRQSGQSKANSVFNSFVCGIKDLVKPQPKNSDRHSYHEPTLVGLASEASYATAIKRSLTPDLVNQNDGKMSNKFPSSISSPNLAKQDSGSSTGSSNRLQSDLITFSEEYSRGIEEREKRMEERRPSSSRTSSGSNSVNGENRTPKSKKRTVQLPNNPNREIKPSTILRLEDRDLVVIDKHDIKEAVNNESQVIIVDPPPLTALAAPSDNEHVDLGDILCGDWPDLAGGAATILNSEKKSSNMPHVNGWKTLERNKSPNFASHFSNSKPRRGVVENGFDKKSESILVLHLPRLLPKLHKNHLALETVNTRLSTTRREFSI